MNHASALELSSPVARFVKSPVNWLFLFVPTTIALEYIDKAPAPARFFSAALAIVPIAAWIGHSTEQLALRTGDAVGGLLNASFSNATELILCLVALRAGYLEMVRATLIGAILANLLLALGAAFLTGGLRHHEQRFNPGAARAYSTMMFLAAVSMAVPSSYSHYFAPGTVIHHGRLLNAFIAGLLLIAYAFYLLFSLRTHPGAFASIDREEAESHKDEQWGLLRAVGSLVGASLLAAWMSSYLVGSAQQTGKSLRMSQVFMGIVFLALIGNAAESGAAIGVARKNKMDLSVSLVLGSCIQIALLVAPLLILASYLIAPEPLSLAFGRAEIGSLFIAVIIGGFVCGDGQSNWYKGVQLITVYAMIALMFYFMPDLN
jgi:Ca2+:H+ antiporter